MTSLLYTALFRTCASGKLSACIKINGAVFPLLGQWVTLQSLKNKLKEISDCRNVLVMYSIGGYIFLQPEKQIITTHKYVLLFEVRVTLEMCEIWCQHL
jgi:hypothetical protein